MKAELELYIDNDNGTEVLEKMTELAKRATELGFFMLEAEVEATGVEEEEEEEDEGEEKD